MLYAGKKIGKRIRSHGTNGFGSGTGFFHCPGSIIFFQPLTQSLTLILRLARPQSEESYRKDDLTRVSAAIALWLLEGKSQPTLDLLRRNSDPIDWRTRLFTADSLGEFGGAAKVSVPALLELLHDENEAVREHAVEALRKIDPTAAEKARVE